LKQIELLVRYWLPGQPVTEQTMGEALYMEKRHWKQMREAVTAGINGAL
jgi:hypothetical protein